MSLTWTPTPKSLEESLEIINYSCSKYDIRFLNGGEFYGPDLINLKYLLAFWKKYASEYPDLVISVKGGISVERMGPDGSEENLTRSIENFASFFPKEKSKRPTLIYQQARVDPDTPYETSIATINKFVEKGVIDGISLSEVGVGSINKATSVATVSCVEIELSLLCQEIFENGVLKELSDKGITVVAYSPLCRGFLTDRTVNDFDSFFELCNRPGDIRGHIPRFTKEHFHTNLKIVQKLYEFAQKKNISLESLALSWVISLSGQENYRGIKKVAKIVPIPSGSTPDKVDLNLAHIVKLTRADLDEILEITDNNKPSGDRSSKEIKHLEFA